MNKPSAEHHCSARSSRAASSTIGRILCSGKPDVPDDGIFLPNQPAPVE